MKRESRDCATRRLYYFSVHQIFCPRQVILCLACSKSGVSGLVMSVKGHSYCELKGKSTFDIPVPNISTEPLDHHHHHHHHPLVLKKYIESHWTGTSCSLFYQKLTIWHVLSVTDFCIRICTPGRRLSTFKLSCNLYYFINDGLCLL